MFKLLVLVFALLAIAVAAPGPSAEAKPQLLYNAYSYNALPYTYGGYYGYIPYANRYYGNYLYNQYLLFLVFAIFAVVMADPEPKPQLMMNGMYPYTAYGSYMPTTYWGGWPKYAW
ncbi:hypothetical protein RN001_009054 [Aquatica leii]|uniref:Uncharacterized protein n=1 Tax=Aquatica leii TaxID=1421715 RepID=A0AAN7P635_9COLE|nr:hypothetical protein RN001_009054 [Aquatica leii]